MTQAVKKGDTVRVHYTGRFKDANHPLARKMLFFDLEVVEVVPK